MTEIKVITLTEDQLEDMFRRAFLYAQMQKPDKEIMSKQELSDYLGWSISKVERKMKDGLPYIGGKGEHPRFKKSDVDAYIRRKDQ